ncbi:Hypothetical predicted protein [Olea europaea subsp. europaea]|uniref:Uncharacterized protein n=1 Tax=Olea europaea subsp. europaea TaxID=158383 RepID=A0A8S0SXM7_OLEEU|nr:Hypothetical predicted protein [Olea europaea subsp. europaea]
MKKLLRPTLLESEAVESSLQRRRCRWNRRLMVAVLADESLLLESEADGNIGMVCVVALQISTAMA